MLESGGFYHYSMKKAISKFLKAVKFLNGF